jgi:hypothetical protein
LSRPARHRLAIASGGRREQIEFALRETPIEKDFTVLPGLTGASLDRLHRLFQSRDPQIL